KIPGAVGLNPPQKDGDGIQKLRFDRRVLRAFDDVTYEGRDLLRGDLNFITRLRQPAGGGEFEKIAFRKISALPVKIHDALAVYQDADPRGTASWLVLGGAGFVIDGALAIGVPRLMRRSRIQELFEEDR